MVNNSTNVYIFSIGMVYIIQGGKVVKSCLVTVISVQFLVKGGKFIIVNNQTIIVNNQKYIVNNPNHYK
jgi:hypothetical protein